jgi:mono/diheme cytochrome c family protein
LAAWAFVAISAVSAPGAEPAPAAWQYNRDIRPILAENCFACHGPDSAARKADLRLDQREAAIKAGAIAPKNLDESELIARILSTDPRQVMPPPSSTKTLSPEQKEILKSWIAAGAEYQPHWSTIPPRRPDLPPVRNTAWVKNPIDRFILAKLEEKGLSPAPEADRSALARRLSLDLTGLPPNPEIVTAFLNDQSPTAYENLVTKLLESPRWGEHRARYWLDAARYADTNGYHFDNYREAWAFRDWAIAAFNRNLSFDRFTIEQLAGDLLPGATLDQQVASGFNRCNATTNEGGVIPEEYTVLYTRDRTETMSQVWLGLTTGCAVCHDHKFDPFSQREFYELAAFFNNTTQPTMDANVHDTPPTVFVPSPADRPRWEALPAERARLKAQLDKVPQTPKELDDRITKLEIELAGLKLDREEIAIKKRGTFAHVMHERAEPAMAFILDRGEYDKRRDPVKPGTPKMLPPLAPHLPRNRLGLAQWLVSPENPLTARVTVNRVWQELFGTGLVRSTGDLGISGELPSHPELLDWLAVELRETGWDLKRFYRLVVESATYRQSAASTPEKREKDPSNRLLSRGPRFRMDGEMIRDAALSTSGLLSAEIGGPSVKPYQPEGVWEAVAMPESNTHFYRPDHGKGLYRRSLYTFWKRSAPPAAFEIFNAPSREVCTVRRERTNTPLQALVTLNDPQFVEAARAMAQSLLTGKYQSTSTDERIDVVAMRLLSRKFRDDERAIVLASLARLSTIYQSHPEQALELLKVGESPAPAGVNPSLLAAWTMLANELMNLDEFLCK